MVSKTTKMAAMATVLLLQPLKTDVIDEKLLPVEEEVFAPSFSLKMKLFSLNNCIFAIDDSTTR